MSSVRQKYSETEDNFIVVWLWSLETTNQINPLTFREPSGATAIKIWEKAEQIRVTPHSAASMRERYRKKLKPADVHIRLLALQKVGAFDGILAQLKSRVPYCRKPLVIDTHNIGDGELVVEGGSGPDHMVPCTSHPRLNSPTSLTSPTSPNQNNGGPDLASLRGRVREGNRSMSDHGSKRVAMRAMTNEGRLRRRARAPSECIECESSEERDWLSKRMADEGEWSTATLCEAFNNTEQFGMPLGKMPPPNEVHPLCVGKAKTNGMATQVARWPPTGHTDTEPPLPPIDSAVPRYPPLQLDRYTYRHHPTQPSSSSSSMQTRPPQGLEAQRGETARGGRAIGERAQGEGERRRGERARSSLLQQGAVSMIDNTNMVLNWVDGALDKSTLTKRTPNGPLASDLQKSNETCEANEEHKKWYDLVFVHNMQKRYGIPMSESLKVRYICDRVEEVAERVLRRCCERGLFDRDRHDKCGVESVVETHRALIDHWVSDVQREVNQVVVRK
eukprot:GHVN01060529.1.p1 GENE.GHVN01060529.1~~GHVN01060529.1.p1  ORF type:complete len:504 (-),score=115.18 GHVN01060529.1:202-1713(-)